MRRSVITVDGLGKEYVIGRRAKANESFREMLASSLSAPFNRLRRLSGQVDVEERFWALQDVNFEVNEGEIIGIIGRNGAGKSTLLKILSRITTPTTGKIAIRGRVASLLEVGTGFHPELTGRENVYLNGAILGMSRSEISRKFDEIVGFAGIDEFLDTPVKRYSSGMYVRLAFAVAAHLEPDILLVDEILAVGDAQFQKKCLGRMRDTALSGRTVILVSHNMGAIRVLCDKCILLEGGRILRYGSTPEVISDYFDSEQFSDIYQREPATGHKIATIVRAMILRADDLRSQEDPAVYIDVDVWASKATTVAIDVRFKDGLGIPVAYGTIGSLTLDRPVELGKGLNRLRIRVLLSGLALGDYLISLDLNAPCIEYYDRAEDCLKFRLDASMLNGISLPQTWGYGSSLLTVEQVGLGQVESHRIGRH